MLYLQYFLCVSNPLPTPYAYRVFQPTAYVFFFTASPQRFTMLLCVFVVVCVVVVACVCVGMHHGFLPQIAVVVRANPPESIIVESLPGIG